MAVLDNSNSGYIDPKTVSPRPAGMRWGAILGLISVALTLLYMMLGIIDFSGQKSNMLSNIISWAVMIGIFYFAFKQHRDEELGGFISLGRCVSLGFWISLISGFIGAVFIYVYFGFINPDFMANIMDVAVEQAESRGQDPEQVRQGMEMVGWMFSPGFFAAMGLIMSLIFGLVFSALVGLVVKKEAPRPF
jgi:hypothetical protein